MFTRFVVAGAASLALTALMGATALGAQASDAEVRQQVVKRLFDKDITEVDVSVRDGVATLHGTVPTLWIKQKAIEEARHATDAVTVVSNLSIRRGESDGAIAFEVASRLRRYIFFTIFDDADVDVHDGEVTLKGVVTMPYKAEALADLAAHVRGVQAIDNRIRVLPVSRYDDELRFAIARELYGDPLFSQYAIETNPPIHIIVERGFVTLTGVVNTELERRKAEAIARTTFPVFSVTNKLEIGD
jgi:hyperosmotically inducible periplasmic protein